MSGGQSLVLLNRGERQLPREYIGQNIGFDFFSGGRSVVFLDRNMKRSLERHAKRLKGTNPIDEAKIGEFGLINDYSARDEGVEINGVDEHDLNGVVAEPRQNAISKATLEVRRKGHDAQVLAGRRSLRRKADEWRDDSNLELIIYVRNIRKKLNWKSNKPADNERPRKRIRARELQCHAHLTIWAKNPASTSRDDDWIIKASVTEECTMKRGDADSDNGKSRYLELNMPQPFRVRSQNLKIPVNDGKVRSLQMAPRYFMEIKIVPVSIDEDWPPIPLLTRADTETRDLEDSTRNSLKNCLVAQYNKLPEPPSPLAPLSVSFLEQATMATKYGLELDARWESPRQKTLSDLEDGLANLSWLSDDNLIPRNHTVPPVKGSTPAPTASGRSTPVPKPTTNGVNHQPSSIIINGVTSATETPAPIATTNGTNNHPQIITNGARSTTGTPAPTRPPGQTKTLARKSTRPIKHILPPNPSVRYVLYLTKMKRETNPYRILEIKGYRCQSCPHRIFKSIEPLLLHLNLNHREKFTLEPQDDLAIAQQIYTIKIERYIHKEHQPRDEVDEFLWQAGPNPFDIRKHTIDQDHSFLGALEASKTKRKERRPVIPAIIDPSSEKRANNKGHLPAKDVLPFRPSIHNRKKHKVPHLKTRHHVPPYASISFRTLEPGMDSDRSETDDEGDDTPFVARHLEELDLYAREENFSVAQHRLARKWDYHILARERSYQSNHARYLSDSLVRFVRIEKSWLRAAIDDDPEVLVAWMDMIAEFVNDNVITPEVAVDLDELLFAESVDMLGEEHEILQVEKEIVERNVKRIEEMEEAISNKTEMLAQARVTNMVSEDAAGCLPEDFCWMCESRIEDMNLALRCSNIDCKVPNVYCHAICGGVDVQGQGEEKAGKASTLLAGFMKDRVTWRCTFCAAEKGKKRED